MDEPFAAPRRGPRPVIAAVIVMVVGAFALGWFVGRSGLGADRAGDEDAPAQTDPVRLTGGDVAEPATVTSGSIVQDQWDSHIPVRHDQYSEQFQKVAQTFTPPEGAESWTRLDLFVGYAIGTRAFVHIVEVPNRRDFVSARVLRTVRMDLFEAKRGTFYSLAIDPPIPLEAGTTYGFLVEVNRTSDELGIGLISTQDVYDGGEAWYFTRQIGGNGEIISNQHAWQYQHNELTFRTSFES